MSTLIETLDDRELETRIAKTLRTRQGRATLADVVVDTALPNLEAERLLRRMIGEYPCHLEVTEDGDILYEFDPAMRRHDEIGRGRRLLRRLGEKAWAGFRVFMKALIAIVLVTYVVLFVVLIIAAMVAAQRGDNRSSSSRRSSSGGGGLFWFWFWAFGHNNDPYRRHTRHNSSYSRWARKSSKGKDDRPFYLKVYSFVLGPEPGDVEPLENERALLAYVREKGGAVTTAEVASRTGWSLPEAEQALTRMVARYEGNLALSEEGRLVFTFAELRKTAASKEGKRAPAYWDRWEQALPVTGNTSGTNLLVGGLTTFTLVAALAAPSAILPPLGWQASFGLLFVLHYVPIAFAGLVFAVPGLRWLLHVRPENARRRFRNFRRALYAVVFDLVHRGKRWIRPDALAAHSTERLPTSAYAPEATPSALEGAVARVAPELGGDLLPEEGDEVEAALGWRFDELADDLVAGDAVRRELAKDDAQVRVVFSTRSDDPPDEDQANANLAEARAELDALLASDDEASDEAQDEDDVAARTVH